MINLTQDFEVVNKKLIGIFKISRVLSLYVCILQYNNMIKYRRNDYIFFIFNLTLFLSITETWQDLWHNIN